MLIVEDLVKRYDLIKGSPGGGVFGANFTVKEGELFTLLGPSGCGKTTTLRSIAGLEQPTSGKIGLAGQDVFNSKTGTQTPGHKRDIGMVFQSYAIWPHMTVFENAAYPLRVAKKKMSEDEIRKRVLATLSVVGLEQYADRNSPQLSGGQQQRLALARALTREPKVLLLDEPLSNLDALLREQMRNELQMLQSKAGVTSIYVTHDQSEALAISDRIAVMNKGLIVQLGTPKQIYEEPASEFVASFIGRTNLIRTTAIADTSAKSLGKVHGKIGEFVCHFPQRATAGQELALVIRPENIKLCLLSEASAAPVDGHNRLQGTVRHEIYLGEMIEYDIQVDGLGPMLVRSADKQSIAAGDKVMLEFPYARTIALPGEKQNVA